MSGASNDAATQVPGGDRHLMFSLGAGSGCHEIAVFPSPCGVGGFTFTRRQYSDFLEKMIRLPYV